MGARVPWLDHFRRLLAVALLLPRAVPLAAPAASARPPKVLLIGVTGGTGQRAVRGLLDSGLPASALHVMSRDPQKPESRALADKLGVALVRADLEDETSLRSALDGSGFTALYVHGTTGDTKSIDTSEVPRARRLAGLLLVPFFAMAQHWEYRVVKPTR